MYQTVLSLAVALDVSFTTKPMSHCWRYVNGHCTRGEIVKCPRLGNCGRWHLCKNFIDNGYCQHVAHILYTTENLCTHQPPAPGYVVAEVPQSYFTGAVTMMRTPPDGFEWALTPTRGKSPDLMQLSDVSKRRSHANEHCYTSVFCVTELVVNADMIKMADFLPSPNTTYAFVTLLLVQLPKQAMSTRKNIFLWKAPKYLKES